MGADIIGMPGRGVCMQKEYRENSFSITLKGNVFTIEGNVESADNEKAIAFLKNSCDEINNGTIILDFSSTRYINSMGIRMLAGFLIDCNQKIEMHIDYSVNWQRISIAALAKIKPDKISLA
jgi:hypothetical protein